MINLSVDSHGNHPRSRQKERRRSRKACESDSGRIHKDDCSRVDCCLIKKGILLGTIAHVLCQFISPYFKFIAYKLTLEIIKKRPASQAALASLTKYHSHGSEKRNRFFC